MSGGCRQPASTKPFYDDLSSLLADYREHVLTGLRVRADVSWDGLPAKERMVMHAQSTPLSLDLLDQARSWLSTCGLSLRCQLTAWPWHAV